MALFHFGKKKEENVPCCSCSETPAAENCCTSAKDTCCGEAVKGICCIKVLGAGCKACHEQYESVKTAVKHLGLCVDVEYITDMEKITEYGVMSMPAIVINHKVVSMGKVLKAADVEKLLKKANG